MVRGAIAESIVDPEARVCNLIAEIVFQIRFHGLQDANYCFSILKADVKADESLPAKHVSYDFLNRSGPGNWIG